MTPQAGQGFHKKMLGDRHAEMDRLAVCVHPLYVLALNGHKICGRITKLGDARVVPLQPVLELEAQDLRAGARVHLKTVDLERDGDDQRAGARRRGEVHLGLRLRLGPRAGRGGRGAGRARVDRRARAAAGAAARRTGAG